MILRIEQQQKMTGFTIVELLVVIVVIGILAGLSFVAYGGIQRQVKAVVLKNDLQAAASHLEAERGWGNSYPADLAAADLPTSDGTVYQYTVDNTSRPIAYCLSALNMSIIGTSFYITDEGKIKEGVCPGHSGNPAYINLASNSSFEAVSGTVAMRTNLVENPKLEVDDTYWSGRVNGGSFAVSRSGLTPPSGFSVHARASSPYDDRTYLDVRYNDLANGGVDAVTPGETYFATAIYRASAALVGGTARTYIQWLDASGSIINTQSTLHTSDIPAGWHRYTSDPEVAPAGTVSASFVFRIYETDIDTGSFLDITGFSFSNGTDYFDGSTPASGDFTYAWAGVANASTSVQQAPKVTGLVGHPSNGSKVYQSQEWASNGDSSVAITAASTGSTDTFAQFGLSVEQGKTYTILATANMPNDAYLGSTSRRRTICIYGGQSVTGGVETASESAPIGVGTVRLVFTAAATGTAQVRLYSGAATETARWDDLLIVEGEYTGPYFQ